jgi:hypothetical protein
MTRTPRFVLGVLSLSLGLSQTPGAQPRGANPSAATVENQSLDPNTGVITFELVNHASSALIAFTYEIQYTTAEGDVTSGAGRSEDYAGAIPMLEAVAAAGLSTHVPEEALPLTGRQTFQEELGVGSTAPTVRVQVALFADGTSFGSVEAIREFKRERVKKVEHLGLYLAALRIAEKSTKSADVFAALDTEADARPAVRDELRSYRAELQGMELMQVPGDVHEHLHDWITIIEAQRNGVARGH